MTNLDPAAPEPRSNAEAALMALREAARGCTSCDLYARATQTVFGEGPASARILMVGEQPGDKEDLAGRPFVGPAGAMLDGALHEAEIARGTVYITNAVKHFKWQPRGKFRLHAKPNTAEISACRWWLAQELALVKPALVVALGATAVQALLGKATTISSVRGRKLALPDDTPLVVTVHPSFLLRLPDEDAKQRERAAFVRDLVFARSLLESV